MKIKGNVYAITGAASGIGLACTKALIAEGAKVVLIDRNEEGLKKICQELGDLALPLVVDVTNTKEVDQLLERILALTDGKLSGFHANAGVYVRGSFKEGDADSWDRILSVNINAVFRSVKAVLPHFIAQKSGDILVTGSISGLMTIPDEPVYSASKHAIHGFIRSLRCQLTPYSVRVGAVAPGPVKTQLIKNEWTEKEMEEATKEWGLIEAEEVAEAVVFMLTRSPKVTIRELTILPSRSDF